MTPDLDRRFGETTADLGLHFVATTVPIRRDHLVMGRVNVTGRIHSETPTLPGRRSSGTMARTGAAALRGEATGRTHLEGAAPDHLRPGREAQVPAGRVGTGMRVRFGTRARSRAVAGLSRRGPGDGVRRTGREGGRHSGQDRLEGRVRAANGADMAEGRAVVDGRAGLGDGHQVATVDRDAMVMRQAMRDHREGRRIEVGVQAVRSEAVRAGRRAIRRDELVAGRDL